MPVIAVHALAGAGGPDVASMLAAVNTAATAALDLPPEAAHSMFVPATTGCTGTHADRPWPTAVIFGRRRDASAMQAASRAVTAVLAETCSQPAERVWVQWVTTE